MIKRKIGSGEPVVAHQMLAEMLPFERKFQQQILPVYCQFKASFKILN